MPAMPGTGSDQSQELGTESESPTWVEGTQPSGKPPGMCITRRLESGTELEFERRHSPSSIITAVPNAHPYA